MVFVVRIDLRYVPWDSDRTPIWGHHELAMIVRLLELARGQGYVFHFFATEPVVRAFPTLIPTILNEGHAFGWLKNGEGNEEGMEQICKLNGHKLQFIANDHEVFSTSGGQSLCCGQSLENVAIADQPWGHSVFAQRCQTFRTFPAKSPACRCKSMTPPSSART